jgi:hypothetical protein
VYGIIEEYDCNAGYINMTVDTPEGLAGDLTVQISGDTRFKECDGDSTVRISCGELEEDWYARIIGVADGDTYVAIRVIQYVPPEE